MSRPKAAQRVAAERVTASLAALLSPARAEASRRNGAKSQGPKTPDGKARASRNALKHGLRAEKHVVVEGESAAAFAAFEAALIADLAPAGALQALLAGRIARAAWRLERAERIEAELFAHSFNDPFGKGDLAPQGALQTLLAGRIARAAWRLERAERIEAELFARHMMKDPVGDGDLGLALIRDGNGARAFDMLLRYRGAAQAELFRTLRTLRALQAEQAQAPAPIEPERRAIAGESAPPALPAAGSLRAGLAPRQPTWDAPAARPNEAESRTNPGESVSMPRGRAALLAATALIPPDDRSS